MSRSYENDEENFEKRKPDYLGEVESRDMRSVDDKGYTGESLEEDEATRKMKKKATSGRMKINPQLQAKCRAQWRSWKEFMVQKLQQAMKSVNA